MCCFRGQDGAEGYCLSVSFARSHTLSEITVHSVQLDESENAGWEGEGRTAWGRGGPGNGRTGEQKD